MSAKRQRPSAYCCVSSAGKRLEEWMRQLGWNDQRLGGAIGKDRTAILRYRHGHRLMTTETVTKIAEAMGIRPEDLWHNPSQ